jgi:HEAT repeat protein
MKFKDLFLPKIARSNPNVRKKAVLAEKNPQVLKGVIKNDSDKGVRETAIKRLKKLNS